VFGFTFIAFDSFHPLDAVERWSYGKLVESMQARRAAKELRLAREKGGATANDAYASFALGVPTVKRRNPAHPRFCG
jgi:hypothetical protein